MTEENKREKENKSVFEIVWQYLEDNDYDGLYNPNDDCACSKDDLEPCSQMSSECTCGYTQPCDCGDHDYHIGLDKPWEVSEDD